ncbi:hypothetical protein Marpi_1284 [Marinitoga piezophila KA3]|uniref:ABC-2 family transporter protein n=1 Tax=Marinitoga piezophila (strain DSM 14283 / JCM 11233 / KA3) TaxID=443254 RepID=H2J2Z6_MARPK|nr:MULTISPECIES: ABC transporter permease subunit [Marinitoga]AEX85687.1 hypothetical protein Marpi_1284 [Marinitoga piezophila KA3]APT76138.1 ABC transporter permease [Marinitoga sp. 1137]NUU97802.1 ABC transporter permease [Marinitoga sp. 1138]
MKKELYEMKTRTIISIVILILLFFSIAPFQKFYVDMIKENMAAIKPYAEKFGFSNILDNLNDWNYYMYTQWFGKNFGQLIPIFAIIFAFPLFSREYENGTMEYLLVRKSRDYVFITKVYIGLTMFIIWITIGIVLPAAYSLISGKDLAYSLLFKYFIHMFFGGLFWYEITVLFSVIFNDQVKPILVSVGTLIITTAAGFIKPLSFLNTYPYILGSKIISEGKIDLLYTLSLFLIGETIVSIAYYQFRKKEI